MSWLMGNWPFLCRITENKEGKRWFDLCKPDGWGVYRLIGLIDSTSMTPASIDRVCGNDPTGTLYVGETLTLNGRLGELIRTHIPGGHGRHRKLPLKLAERFPPEKLAVTWEWIDRDDPGFTREAGLFQAYEAQFGERPPLNWL